MGKGGCGRGRRWEGNDVGEGGCNNKAGGRNMGAVHMKDMAHNPAGSGGAQPKLLIIWANCLDLLDC